MKEREFRSFYDEVAPPLRAYLARASGDGALADDLLQESLYRFLRSGFEGDDAGHRKNYLYRIASNLLRDHWRRRRPESVMPEIAAPDPEFERRESRQQLLRGMASMTARERQLLWLAHVEQFSHREIAQILGVGEASVRVLAFHARKKLARNLAKAEARATESAGLESTKLEGALS